MAKCFGKLVAAGVVLIISGSGAMKAQAVSGYIDLSSSSSSNSTTTTPVKTSTATSATTSKAISTDTSNLAATNASGATSTSTGSGASTTAKPHAIASSSAASSAGLATNVQLASVQVQPYSGSASLSYPVSVPPGRAGIQPNLLLIYSSSSRQLGNAGIGWNLDLGAIQISTKKGTPKYDGTDIFTMEQNGATQDLVADPTTAGLYHMEVEGNFARIQYFTTYWVVTDKEGIKYYYGNTNDSKQSDPVNPTHIFHWALNKVEDLNGNYMIISYLQDNGQLYPQTISYTGNDYSSPILSTYAQVNISYASASIPSASYLSNFLIETAQRIDYVTVSVGSNVQSTYKFAYIQSSDSGRDLLQSIQQTGSDGTTILPAVNFTYSNASLTYQAASSVASSFHGDNLWNFACNGGYDHGHNNYGVKPPNDFGWGTVLTGPYTQSSGNVGTGNWSIDSKGNLSFQGRQDAADQFWTYLYVKTARTLYVPISGADVAGAFVNSSSDSGSTWSLQAGWNIVYITMYNQNQGLNYNLNYELADNVDIMSSSQLSFSSIAGDYDGDGKTDIGTFNSSNGTFNVSLSNGSGFSGSTPWISNFGANQNIMSGDFNGDGRADIAFYNATAGNVDVALSNGSKFVDNGVWLSGIASGSTVLTGDFDGDGLIDLYIVSKDASGWMVQIAKNTGTSFQLLPTVYRPRLGSINSTIMTADFNGDGLTDLVGFDSSNGTWSVNLNANGFTNSAYYSTTGFGVGQTPVMGDFNQDGNTDIGYYRKTDGVTVYLVSVLNGFSSQQQANFSSSMTGSDTQIQNGDFNGDGAIDYMVSNSIGQNEIFSSKTIPPNEYLTHIDNGIGGTTDITYDSALHYQNTYLPFYIPVVKSTTTTLGSQSYITRYNYAGGLWDTTYREFDGFSTVTATDPQGNYVTSTYSQDHWLKGHPSEQDTYDSKGNLYSKSVNQWQAQTIVTNSTSNQTSKFLYVSRVDNYLYDGDSSATPKRTAQEFTYGENPQYGNVTQTINDGQVDSMNGASIDPNQTTIQISYLNNLNNWLIGLPSITITQDASGNLISKTSFYYDGGATGSAVPSLGKVSAKVNWLGSNTLADPKTTYTYDGYGNLKTTTDPNGNMTTIVYDNTVHMFPVQTINALKQSNTMTYYGVDSTPLDDGNGLQGLWGQGRSKTDANNQTAYTTYDALGRPLTSISPLDSIALPSQQKSYNIQPSYIEITDTTRVDSGSSSTISATSFYDGLGRLVESKSPAPTVAQGYIVSGQTVYDNRGLPTIKYLPYFTNNDLNTLDAINASIPSAQQSYDPMGRVLTKTNPDGTYSSTAYNQWTTTTTDENGHQQVSFVDAFGRLVTKQEYTGADGRSPYYPKAPYVLLATTTYGYNPRGNLVSVRDNNNNLTSITYDNLGRKIAMNDPDMGSWSYGYDNNGNLQWQKDAKGQIITFSYDALNRLSNKTDSTLKASYPNLTVANPQPPTFNVKYNFDDQSQNYGIGRLGSVGYDLGSAGFIYDPLGREIASSKTIASTNFTVNRQYNALNQLQQLQYPDASKVKYIYNQAGQVIGISDAL